MTCICVASLPTHFSQYSTAVKPGGMSELFCRDPRTRNTDATTASIAKITGLMNFITKDDRIRSFGFSYYQCIGYRRASSSPFVQTDRLQNRSSEMFRMDGRDFGLTRGEAEGCPLHDDRTGAACALDERGSDPRLGPDRISADFAGSNNVAFPFNRNFNQIIRVGADRAARITNLGVNTDPIGSISPQLAPAKIRLQFNPARTTRRMNQMGRYQLPGDISPGHQLDRRFFHPGHARHVHRGLLMGKAFHLEGEWRMRQSKIRIRLFSPDFPAIQGQAHLVAIAEHCDRRRRKKSGKIGDKNHRPIIQPRNMNLGRPLALEKVVTEFRQPEQIQHAAIKRLMMISALAIDPRPETR